MAWGVGLGGGSAGGRGGSGAGVERAGWVPLPRAKSRLVSSIRARDYVGASLHSQNPTLRFGMAPVRDSRF